MFKFPLQALAFVVSSFVVATTLSAAPAENARAGASVISLDGEWLIATDAGNIGRDQKWFNAPRPDAKKTKVPWIIQDAFPAYHGVAWYWHDFTAPAKKDADGRFLLKFWGVDFRGDVWLNGKPIGSHEGGETPFTLDVTDTLKPGEINHVAVRVLNPTNEPIDGYILSQTPRQARILPYSAGSEYNCGGITDSVELISAPAVRIDDIFAKPDTKSSSVHIRIALDSAAKGAASRRLEVSVAPAVSGETVASTLIEREIASGAQVIEADLPIASPHLWNLNDPFLYRVTVKLSGEKSSPDEQSVRCGFRDFRFDNGYFRLNGKRLFLRSTHTCNNFPVGQRLPLDPDQARRDLIDLKAMGFNTIRFIWGGTLRYQLELCDEIGLMVYEEHFSSNPMTDSDKLQERWDRGVSELITRDRNHPSVVVWALLNETPKGMAFNTAVKSLPMVRKLDDSRMVFLNSGRWDIGPGGDVYANLDIWFAASTHEPWVTHNPSDKIVDSPFGFSWAPGQVALHPGPKGEYSVVRFTAPEAGKYSVDALFTGMPKTSPATTDVHLLGEGKELFSDKLNLEGRPNAAGFKGIVSLEKGTTLDFVVGIGNDSYGSDSTALTAWIKSPAGKVYDVAADFSGEKNASGAWSYGMIPPGAKPVSEKFIAHTESGKKAAAAIGSLSNPGSMVWEDVLADSHQYPRVPHTGPILAGLRTTSGGRNPMLLSEYGIGSAVDLWRVTRHFERIGKADSEDGRFYKDKLDRYLADYDRYKLDELYARPEDFFAESLRKMAGQRSLGLSAIRANPNIIGYSLTGMNDHVSCGEGLTTTFREFKPGTVDAIFEGFAPLKWCLSAEPVNVYRGSKVHIEAVLSNEDALAPGEYPVRIQVVGPFDSAQGRPNNTRVFDQIVQLKIPAPAKDGKRAIELPFALPVFKGDVVANGPSGKYRLLATMQRGGAPTCGETEFYVADPAEMPKAPAEVVLWGDDPLLSKWLADHGVKVVPLGDAGAAAKRQVILVGATPPAGDAATSFTALAQHIWHGDTAIFLSSEIFRKGDQPLGWLPLATKGATSVIPGWLYLKDEWAKKHPIFDGLPAGGLMDYTFYREIIPDALWQGQDVPAEAVAGAIKASQDYTSGLLVSVNNLGSGRFILNTLLIRDNLGHHPAADRLLVNMLNYASKDAEKPLADPAGDFAAALKSIGYPAAAN